jgi:hypothetical protein
MKVNFDIADNHALNFEGRHYLKILFMTIFRHINRSLFIISILLLCVSCNRYKKKLVWDKLESDPKLSKTLDFGYQPRGSENDKNSQDSFVFEQKYIMWEATANEKFKGLYASESTKDYTCNAMLKSDTLFIRFDCNPGMGGHGLSIMVFNKYFSIFPYSWSDNISYEPETDFPIIKTQSLILNKKQYNIGDEIYGTFYLKTEARSDIISYWNANFKCKVY